MPAVTAAPMPASVQRKPSTDVLLGAGFRSAVRGIVDALEAGRFGFGACLRGLLGVALFEVPVDALEAGRFGLGARLRGLRGVALLEVPVDPLEASRFGLGTCLRGLLGIALPPGTYRSP